jgi:hypothetical protein
MTEQQIIYNTAPLTPGQWLLRSLYWVGGCYAGVWLLTHVMLALEEYVRMLPATLAVLLLWGSCCFSIFLIWRKVLCGSSAVLLHDPRQGAFSWLRLLMIVWRVVLVLNLVLYSGFLLLNLAALIADTFFHEPMGDYF